MALLTEENNLILVDETGHNGFEFSKFGRILKSNEVSHPDLALLLSEAQKLGIPNPRYKGEIFTLCVGTLKIFQDQGKPEESFACFILDMGKEKEYALYVTDKVTSKEFLALYKRIREISRVKSFSKDKKLA